MKFISIKYILPFVALFSVAFAGTTSDNKATTNESKPVATTTSENKPPERSVAKSSLDPNSVNPDEILKMIESFQKPPKMEEFGQKLSENQKEKIKFQAYSDRLISKKVEIEYLLTNEEDPIPEPQKTNYQRMLEAIKLKIKKIAAELTDIDEKIEKEKEAEQKQIDKDLEELRGKFYEKAKVQLKKEIEAEKKIFNPKDVGTVNQIEALAIEKLKKYEADKKEKELVENVILEGNFESFAIHQSEELYRYLIAIVLVQSDWFKQAKKYVFGSEGVHTFDKFALIRVIMGKVEILHNLKEQFLLHQAGNVLILNAVLKIMKLGTSSKLYEICKAENADEKYKDDKVYQSIKHLLGQIPRKETLTEMIEFVLFSIENFLYPENIENILDILIYLGNGKLDDIYRLSDGTVFGASTGSASTVAAAAGDASTNVEEKSSAKRNWLIGGGVVLILVAIILIVIAIRKRKGDQSATTASA